MKSLYHKAEKKSTKIMEKAKKYFTPYMELLTKPSGHKVLMLLLAVLSMQAVTSIQHIYKWFLAGVSKISQNAYYYLLTYTEMPLDKFASVTIRKALSVVEEKCRKLPVVLIVDDTLQAKFGTKFECYSTMFDHARHDGSSYLSGHCFVALTICVPVVIDGRVQYLNVPVRFRLRGKDESKLAIASEMICEAMKTLADVPMVILLCDSWYPKGEVIKTVSSYKNLDLIANVRVDTVMYDLPEPTGKRGRPAKKGKRLCVADDFSFTLVGKYFISARTVITNLFAKPVYMTVTATDPDTSKGYRLFLSTVSYANLFALFPSGDQPPKADFASLSWLLPLRFYSLRWNIEVMFYELKSFWSFGNYMLRSKRGIENLISLLSISYSFAKLIPFADSFFSDFSDVSPQTTKYAFGEAIRKELFFVNFVDFLETHHISTVDFRDFDLSDFFASS